MISHVLMSFAVVQIYDDHPDKLFRAVKDLLVEKNTLCFADYTDKSALVNDLGRYFVEKVTRLRDELDQCAVPDDGDTNSDSSTPLFIDICDTDRRRCVHANWELKIYILLP